jgi:hypothetical protein
MGYFGEDNNVIYYHQLPRDLDLRRSAVSTVRNPRDKARFNEVLTATVELARAQRRGLLFIGGHGWYYDMEIPPEVTPVLSNAGFQFVTRHA